MGEQISSNFLEGVLLYAHLRIPHKPHTWGRKWNLELRAAQPAKPRESGLKESHSANRHRGLTVSAPVSHTLCCRAGLQGHPGGKQGTPASTLSSSSSSSHLFLLSALSPVPPTHKHQISLWASWKKNTVTGKLFLEHLELVSKLS